MVQNSPLCRRLRRRASHTPGGISLRRAAAERLLLGMEIQGFDYRDGKILLSGRPSESGSIDAALLLTALRLACSKEDPYFSLDPIDGDAWLREGRAAGKMLADAFVKKFSQGERGGSNTGRDAQSVNGITGDIVLF